MKTQHNLPNLSVSLSQSLADFVEKNCNANIEAGLEVLSDEKVSDRAKKGIVDLIGNFRAVKVAVRKAKYEINLELPFSPVPDESASDL